MERAQLVWQRALELVDAVERPDRFEVAGDLSRTAHHDPTTMAHALALGRTQLRAGTKNAHVLAAVGVLERAVVFLGVKPIANDTAGGRRRR